jgi:hypothetical protein
MEIVEVDLIDEKRRKERRLSRSCCCLIPGVSTSGGCVARYILSNILLFG